MEKDKISQKKLKKLAEDKGIDLKDRMINYYINLNLLPKPIKIKDNSVSDNDKAENLFDYDHTIFMWEILKKYKLLGFSNISQMKCILGGGRFTLYEELMFLNYEMHNDQIDEGSVLYVCSYEVKVNGRIFDGIAKHSVILPNGSEIDDYPFFPNYDLWYFVRNKREFKEKLDWSVDWRSKAEYFEIEIPWEKKFDPKKYLDKSFSNLYSSSTREE